MTFYGQLGIFDKVIMGYLTADKPAVYQGRIVLLVNSGTISQGEFSVMAWRNASNAMVIGSQTAGANGNVSYLPQPGGLLFTFKGLGISYPDGGQTQRVGIRIDEEVRPTIQGIREGRDEVLERAIEIINQDEKRN